MLPLISQVLDNFNFDVDPNKSREENVEDVVKSAALLSGAIAVEPIPFADMLLITPVQAKMVLHVGKIYGFDMTPERAREVVTELGAVFAYGFAARQVMRGIIKTVAPIIGGVVTAPLVYGWTFALGKLAERYFQAKLEGRTFTKVEQKHVAQKVLPTVEKPTIEALGEFAKELKQRAEQKEQGKDGVKDLN